MPRDSSHSATKLVAPSADQASAAVAARQYGVVTLRQLEACGLGAGAIKRRVAAGRLQRLWRGVYAFGHSELRLEGRLLGAVFACGPGAVLSRRSAADHWGILRTNRAGIEVTVEARGTPGETAGHRPPLHPPPRPARRHRPRRHPHHHRRPHPGRPLRRRPAPHGREGAGAVLRAAVDRSGSHRGRTGASPRPEDQCTEEPARNREARADPHPQRARGGIPRPMPPGRPAGPRGERAPARLRGRLPVARAEESGRGRRLRLPLSARSLRTRPQKGRGPGTRRLPRHALHARPGHLRAGGDVAAYGASWWQRQ